MQLVPLQDLDVPLFEVEAQCQHARNLAIIACPGRLAEQFHDATVLAVVNRAVLLRDEVGIVLGAHVGIGYDRRAPRAVNDCTNPPVIMRNGSRSGDGDCGG